MLKVAGANLADLGFDSLQFFPNGPRTFPNSMNGFWTFTRLVPSFPNLSPSWGKYPILKVAWDLEQIKFLCLIRLLLLWSSSNSSALLACSSVFGFLSRTILLSLVLYMNTMYNSLKIIFNLLILMDNLNRIENLQLKCAELPWLQMQVELILITCLSFWKVYPCFWPAWTTIFYVLKFWIIHRSYIVF